MYVLVDWMKCTGCGQSNTLFYAKREYRPKRKQKILIGGRCKLCYLEDKRIQERLYYQENREKMSAKAAQWRKDNPEKVKKIYKDYRKKNKLKIKEQKRLKRIENMFMNERIY
jgi:hypothetical protein